MYLLEHAITMSAAGSGQCTLRLLTLRTALVSHGPAVDTLRCIFSLYRILFAQALSLQEICHAAFTSQQLSADL